MARLSSVHATMPTEFRVKNRHSKFCKMTTFLGRLGCRWFYWPLLLPVSLKVPA